MLLYLLQFFTAHNNTIVCRNFHLPLSNSHRFIHIVFINSHPTTGKLFWQYWSIDIWVKHKNKLKRESYFFMLRGLQIKVAFFLYERLFQAAIYATTGWDVTSNVLKRIKTKKACSVKSITATKFIYHYWEAVASPTFTKSWSPFLIFQKSQFPINKGGSHYKKTTWSFIIHTMKYHIYIFPAQFWIAS